MRILIFYFLMLSTAIAQTTPYANNPANIVPGTETSTAHANEPACLAAMLQKIPVASNMAMVRAQAAFMKNCRIQGPG